LLRLPPAGQRVAGDKTRSLVIIFLLLGMPSFVLPLAGGPCPLFPGHPCFSPSRREPGGPLPPLRLVP
jgi:hypothetical protein